LQIWDIQALEAKEIRARTPVLPVRRQALGKRGVLPTRLSAMDEAASINVLCVDRTGTLTKSELAVAAAVPLGLGTGQRRCGHLVRIRSG
jgi:magnesium-transporting ATPase (P-type)